MNHETNNLAGYLDGSLASEARARVERHLEGCALCRDALAQMRHAGLALRDAGRAVSVPAYDGEMWSRVRAQIARPERASRFRPRWAGAWTGLAAAGAMAAVFFLVNGVQPNAPPAGKTTRPSPDTTFAATPSSKKRMVAAVPHLPPMTSPPNAAVSGNASASATMPAEIRPPVPGAESIPVAVADPGASIGPEHPPLDQGKTPPIRRPSGVTHDMVARAYDAAPPAAELKPSTIRSEAPAQTVRGAGNAPAASDTSPTALAEQTSPGPMHAAARSTADKDAVVPDVVASEAPRPAPGLPRLAAKAEPFYGSEEPSPTVSGDVGKMGFRAATAMPKSSRLVSVSPGRQKLEDGRSLLQKNDTVAAAASFQDAIAAGLTSLDERAARIGLGDAAMRRNDAAAALAAYAEAEKIGRDAPLLVKIGRAREKNGDVPAARAAYKSALALQPGNADAQAALARLPKEP